MTLSRCFPSLNWFPYKEDRNGLSPPTCHACVPGTLLATLSGSPILQGTVPEILLCLHQLGLSQVLAGLKAACQAYKVVMRGPGQLSGHLCQMRDGGGHTYTSTPTQTHIRTHAHRHTHTHTATTTQTRSGPTAAHTTPARHSKQEEACLLSFPGSPWAL